MCCAGIIDTPSRFTLCIMGVWVGKGLSYICLSLWTQLRKALEEEEDHNVRLHKYIEGLLVAIIDKHPDILEKR